MNYEFEYLDRIEKYFEGTLSTNEAAQFEADLKTNEVLANELAHYSDIQKGLNVVDEELLRAEIGSVHEELQNNNFFNNITKTRSIMENKDQKNNFGIGRILSIAASVALLVGAAYFFTQDNTPSRADLMAKTEVAPNIEFANKMIEKSASLGFADPGKGKKDTIALIANFYKEGNYKTAIEVINEYIERYSPDYDTEFMLGSCLFQEGEYAKAVKHFLPLLESETVTNKQDVQWMTALSYLKFGSDSADSNARKILQKLIADPADYEPQVLQQYIDMLEN